MYGSTINPASQTTTLDALHLTLCYEPRHQLCSQDFSSSQFLLEALSVSSLLLQISLLEVNAKTKMWVLFFGENPNQISKEVERGQEGTGTNKAWISKHVSIETNWRWFKKKKKSKQTKSLSMALFLPSNIDQMPLLGICRHHNLPLPPFPSTSSAGCPWSVEAQMQETTSRFLSNQAAFPRPHIIQTVASASAENRQGSAQ